jgi:hypothetical protein
MCARRLLFTLTATLCLFVVLPDQRIRAISAPPYTISGKVADGFGNAIPSATVTLSGAQSGTTTTDNNGNYSFANLPSGNYVLSTSKPGGYLGSAVNVDNLSADLTKDLRLDFFVNFTIRVTDGGGIGLGAVTIRVGEEAVAFAQTNSFGNCNLGVNVPAVGDALVKLTPEKPGYTFSPASLTFHSQNGNQLVSFTAIPTGLPISFLQFTNTFFTVGEGDGSITLTVSRTGDTSTAVSCFYQTADTPTATQKSDYTITAGTLSFAPGETSKTFQLLIVDDAFPQDIHTVLLRLSNPTGGASLGNARLVGVIIVDNDSGTPTVNPLDAALFFVRQHYYDFLARLPDQAGLDYWAGKFAHCGSDAQCLREERIGVSAAFFIEQEFRETGFVIYRLNVAALATTPGYTQFMIDRSRLIGGAQLPQSTAAYANDFVLSNAFTQAYPAQMSPADFVNQLFDTAQLSPYTAERAQEIQALSSGSKSRAQVLLEVVEIPEFKSRVFNPAFVLMQYYGYLRRDVDPAGYQFWLDILNDKLPNDTSGYRAMVCAFLTSAEYQNRFSPVQSHSNAECGQ